MDMATTSLQSKKYAVVKFLADSTFFEIPTAWLFFDYDESQLCWWPPRNANSAGLIARCASPNVDTWTEHEVNIIKYCSSLESARKSAADSKYCTTDEEALLGRGKRQYIPCSRYNSSDEESSQPLPKYLRKSKKQPRPNSALSEAPLRPDDFGVKQSPPVFSELSEDYNPDNFSVDKTEIIVQESANTPMTSKTMTTLQRVMTTKQLFLETENSSTQKILRMLATIQFSLQDISQRLGKLESVVYSRASNLPQRNDALISQFLPLTNIAEIKEFETLLKTREETVMQFKEFLAKIGGNNPKDNIQRSLKKIFSNECAVQCSWKGIRNNFRVADLNMTKIIRGEITTRNITLTESEFDAVAAEWLRFAKQRKEREEKANAAKEDD